MPAVPFPPRLSLGSFPTRIQPLRRLSEELGGPSLFVKRDDETGSDLSGNKVRKLEYLLAEARQEGCDLVITCGGVQSNHCRASAVAARRLGMDSLLLLRGQDPGDRDGNLLLDALVGAELWFITPEEYSRRADLMAEAARQARAGGRRPYVIPEGGSNALGAFGYLGAIDELIAQGMPDDPDAEKAPAGDADGAGDRPAGLSGSHAPGFPWDHIVCATGSGGTLAGLLLGVTLRGLPVKIWGVNVCDTASYFQKRVLAIAEEFRLRYLPEHPEPFLAREAIRILEGYKGPGYAVAFPSLLNVIREVARRDGLLLDPVYTGKAFYGLLEEIRAGRFAPGERVLFLHTGGIFSLYAYRKELLGL